MNIDELKGNWKQFKGAVQEKWGELTNDELDKAEGNREQLIGLVQEKYGKSRAAAEQEVDDFMRQH